MTKAKRQMQEDLKLIDLVIELVDARVPLSSRNPDIDEMAKGKSRLILLNKCDLADDTYTQIWKQYFEDKGFAVCAINSLKGNEVRKIQEPVQEVCAEKIERDRRRGIKNRPVRAMITGIPNVGKSTFINTFSRKGAAKTGNRPGVTKGKQWIRLSNTLELLDTPGILWPKFEDQNVGIKLAMIGSIKDEILNTEELALELIRMMSTLYPGALEEYYGLATPSMDRCDSEVGSCDSAISSKDPSHVSGPADAMMLEKIAIARGCIGKGGTVDYARASNILLENFRNGKIGRFTLDRI